MDSTKNSKVLIVRQGKAVRHGRGLCLGLKIRVMGELEDTFWGRFCVGAVHLENPDLRQ